MLHVRIFDMVDTSFSYGRALIVLLLSSGIFHFVKESSLHEISYSDTAFLLNGAELHLVLTIRPDAQYEKGFILFILVKMHELHYSYKIDLRNNGICDNKTD